MQTTISKSAALKQATDESSMYRFGDGWEVSQWDEQCRAQRVSHPMGYSAAREFLTIRRAVRAAILMGLDGDDGSAVFEIEHAAENTTGTARERLAFIAKRFAR